MALNPHHRTNFNTMLEAARQGDLMLMECTDATTGEYRAVICARGPSGVVTPFGHLSNGNPYEDYVPPEPG